MVFKFETFIVFSEKKGRWIHISSATGEAFEEGLGAGDHETARPGFHVRVWRKSAPLGSPFDAAATAE